MMERTYDFDRLPDGAQQDIARLEVDLCDARSELLHVYSALQVLVGAACLAFGYFGRIGSFVFTGSGTIGWVGALFVFLGVVYYVRKDRQNRRSL